MTFRFLRMGEIFFAIRPPLRYDSPNVPFLEVFDG